MLLFSGFCIRCDSSCGRLNRGAIAYFLQTFDNDAIARLQPLLDYPVAADPGANRNFMLRHFIRLVYHPDKVSALQLQHRSLRDEQRAMAFLDFNPYPRVLAGPEDIAGIREDR